MKRLFLFAFFAPVIALASPLDDPDVDGAFSRGESFSHSAANPLTAYLKLLVGPAPDDGQFVLSRNSIEFGYRWNRFEFSLVHRNDQNLYFSQDAAEFAYLNKNGSGLNGIPVDRLYQIYVGANQYQLTGPKVGYTLPIADDLELIGRYAFYHSSEVVNGYIGWDPQGEGGYIGVTEINVGGSTRKDLTGNLYADYYYTSDPLFRRQVKGPSGIGYSFDFGVRWRPLPNFAIEANFFDAIGKIYWRNLPHTTARALGSTDALTITEDENGDERIQVQPNFTGNDDFRDLTQDIVNREKITLDYQYKKFRFGYQFDRMRVVTFHRLLGGFYWHTNWGLVTSYDLTSEAIGFRLAMPTGDLALTFDDTDLTFAHTLGLSWNFTYQF